MEDDVKLAKVTLAALAAAAVFVLALGPAMAAPDGDATVGSIDGGAHDFSASFGNGQICLPCHAPHSALNGASGPIWNHTLTAQTFQRTDWETGTTATVTLGKSSKMCMSCHDGVTNIDAFGGAVGSSVMTGGAAIGTDLTNSHPIGVDYAAVQAAHSHTYEPVSVVEGYLEDGKVECSSCHRAHSAGTEGKFLRKTISGSQICRVCHTF